MEMRDQPNTAGDDRAVLATVDRARCHPPPDIDD